MLDTSLLGSIARQMLSADEVEVGGKWLRSGAPASKVSRP